jgi:DNA-binding XRE family transcriptional regulator
VRIQKPAPGIDAPISEAEARHEYARRRLVHDVSVALHRMRIAGGLTQAQLAKRLGTTRPTVARLELGLDVRTPRLCTLQRVAMALGLVRR